MYVHVLVVMTPRSSRRFASHRIAPTLYVMSNVLSRCNTTGHRVFLTSIACDINVDSNNNACDTTHGTQKTIAGLPIGKEGPFVHISSIVAELLMGYVHAFILSFHQASAQSCG